MSEHDEVLERAIKALKEPVDIDAALDRRVMTAIEQLPSPAREGAPGPRRSWMRMSPLRGLAAAAAIAGVIWLGSSIARNREEPTSQRSNAPEAVTRFVLIAPSARSVSLVGDFNDWDLAATRLTRQSGNGVWLVTIKLPPGRYRYAYVVDGDSWRKDPNAPSADDEFGRPNSVVTVGGA